MATGLKRITVQVTYNGAAVAELQTVRTAGMPEIELILEEFGEIGGGIGGIVLK